MSFHLLTVCFDIFNTLAANLVIVNNIFMIGMIKYIYRYCKEIHMLWFWSTVILL